MVETLHETFNGRRVFLTGHTGFKGSWLALWLEYLGAQVTGYSLDPPSAPNHFHVANVEAGLATHHYGNVVDLAAMEDAIRQARPEIIFHLAAQSVVRTGYEHPLETFRTNVMGTATVLEAVRNVNSPMAVLCVTSDKCYQNREQVWGYRETDAFGDHDPYGASKGAAEVLIRSYRDSFFPPDRIADHGIALASARAGNVIGGGDWKAHALLPDAFRALSSGEPIRVRHPHATRPWQHVLQCLSGYLTIAQKLLGPDAENYCSGWNIGPLPGNELPVHEVLDLFLDEWGTGTWQHTVEQCQLREAHVLRLCIDKAIWQLGWRPCWSVQQSIRETAAWYKHFLDSPSTIRNFSLEQIATYTETMIAQRFETGMTVPVSTWT